MKYLIMIITVFAVSSMFTIWGINALIKRECRDKTEGMGFNTNYSVLGGCRIEVETGRWVPLENYREIR